MNRFEKLNDKMEKFHRGNCMKYEMEILELKKKSHLRTQQCLTVHCPQIKR